jgi:hypothetical protein
MNYFYDAFISFVGCLLTILPLALGYIVAEYMARRAKKRQKDKV